MGGLGRKKRDAEADAYGYGGYGGGVALHPYGGSSYVGPTVWGLGRKKRDADAEAYGGYGFGYDALSGNSFIHRSGVGYWPGGEQRGTKGKREAEADAYGYGGYGGGVALHPYGGSSYVGPTVWGLGRKKRDAEADAYGYGGYGGGVALHPYGGSS